MSLLHLQRAVLFLVGSTGAALAVDTARIEVFATARTPVTEVSAPAGRDASTDPLDPPGAGGPR